MAGMMWQGALVGSLLVAVVGCGSVHPYGFGRTYEPLSAEEQLLERETQLSYEDVRRNPAQYRRELLGWFGLVRAVKPRGERVEATLELRYHQPRHLCASVEEDSCRVTVAARDGGPFSAVFVLNEGDREGARRLAPGSLLKVYGYVQPQQFDDRGGPVVAATFYRHFPLGTYVIANGGTPQRLRR